VSRTVTTFQDYIAIAVPSAADGTICEDCNCVVGTEIKHNSLPGLKIIGFENYIRGRGPQRFWRRYGEIVGVVIVVA